MKIAILTNRGEPSRKGSIVEEIARFLNERQIDVERIFPEESAADVFRLSPRHDLYILKSSSEIALGFARVLHVAGASILNPYPAVAMMKDKIAATKVLQAAGVPIPEAYFAAEAGQLAPFLSAGALVVKPFWAGSKGRGVEVIRGVEELNKASTGEAIVFAQRYHEPDGLDHKIYCIGKQVFGVKRVWPARTYEEKLGEPFAVTPQMRELTLQSPCSAAPPSAWTCSASILFSAAAPLISSTSTVSPALRACRMRRDSWPSISIQKPKRVDRVNL
jgi:ribosomal protein S6--L-glutamate ligase